MMTDFKHIWRSTGFAVAVLLILFGGIATPADVTPPNFPETTAMQGDAYFYTEDGDVGKKIKESNFYGFSRVSLSKYAGNLNSAITDIGATQTVLSFAGATLTADVTVPRTLTLEHVSGLISGAFILTINGGMSGDMTSPWFDPTVTVAGAPKVDGVYPDMWTNNTSPGSTDMAAAIQAAENLMDNIGGKVKFLPQDYAIASTVTADGGVVFEGVGKESNIVQLTRNVGGFNVTGSNVTFRNLKLTGPQYTVPWAGEVAINAYGADSGNYISNVNIENCIFDTWGFRSVRYLYVSDFKITNTTHNNLYYSAFSGASVLRGSVKVYHVNNVVGTPNAYGFALSRIEDDSLVTEPRSANVALSDFVIDNVPNWEAVDTHGGENITIANGVINSSKIGVHIGASDNGSQMPTFAPHNVTVTNVVMDSGVTDGTAGKGVNISGAKGIERSRGIKISNCTIKYFGNDTGRGTGGIFARDTSGLVLNGNSIIAPARYGIHLQDDNYGFSVTGNTISDLWSEDTANPFGIYINNDHQTGYISGNSFKNIGLVAKTYENVNAIRNDKGNSNVAVVLGDNYSDYANYLSGSRGGVTRDR